MTVKLEDRPPRPWAPTSSQLLVARGGWKAPAPSTAARIAIRWRNRATARPQQSAADTGSGRASRLAVWTGAALPPGLVASLGKPQCHMHYDLSLSTLA